MPRRRFALTPWRPKAANKPKWGSARHARWGARLLAHLCSPGDNPQPPWVVAAAAILQNLSGGTTHPAVVWMAVVGQREGLNLPPAVAGGATQKRLPEGAMARLVRGLRALGPLCGRRPAA